MNWTPLRWATFTKQYKLVRKLAPKSNVFELDKYGISPINLALFSLDHELLACFNDSLDCHNFHQNFHKDMMIKLISLDLEPYLIRFVPMITEGETIIEKNYIDCYKEINGFTPMAKLVVNRDVFGMKELVDKGWSPEIDEYVVKKCKFLKGFNDVKHLQKFFE